MVSEALATRILFEGRRAVGVEYQVGAEKRSARAGAEVIVRCFADRVLVEGGRAAGVEAVYSDPQTGRSARVTVRAPRVVVAGGAFE